MILGGIRLWTYDSELTLKPGQGSSVTAAPPITPRFSRTSGRKPARAR